MMGGLVSRSVVLQPRGRSLGCRVSLSELVRSGASIVMATLELWKCLVG